jgi:para-nitrobenzyl esterase
MRIAMAAILALIFPWFAFRVQCEPIQIEHGAVEGIKTDGLIEFRGIPYAAPPVGNLRWKPPQEPTDRPVVLQANSFPPQCPQTWPPLPTMPAEKSSEDCLYLNIWSPQPMQGSGRPVMVFFYGGGFQAGSASTPLYASGGLPRATGVVLVTVNYRIGALGFMAYPLLSAESEHHVSGNYALLDAIAALGWVKRNIVKFGGDPDRVTIFGQSAGSFLINKLMISPFANGLFHAAIAESSADMGDMQMGNLAHAEQVGVALASRWQVTSLDALRSLPVDKLLATEFDARPVVDGYIIPQDTYTAYALGKQSKVPLLLGYNASEGDWLRMPTTLIQYRKFVRATYGSFAPRFLKMYPAVNDTQAAAAARRIGAEDAFGWQMYAWAEVNARTSSAPTYFYHFSSRYGNGHGAELPFVFQYPFGGEWDATRHHMGQEIAGYWTRFAATGDPNGAGAVQWETYNPAVKRVMSLGIKTGEISMPDLEAHRLMDEFHNSKRSPRVTNANPVKEVPESLEAAAGLEPATSQPIP